MTRVILALGAVLCLLACGGDPGPLEGSQAGDCTDGLDNDGDGAIDCDDSGCGAACADAGPVDGGALDGGPGGVDGGPADAGPGAPSLACGDLEATAIDATTSLTVDTRPLTNDVTTCGATAAPGNEGFVALSLAAGERWHFHVAADPSTTGDRDPFVYLLESTCDSSACDVASEQCEGVGDEHFTFDVPATGRYYLGVDDRGADGGTYLVDAVRVECGNGVAEHGEACDGSVNCSARCRQILQASDPFEQEPNDNPMEANEVPGIGSGGSFTVAGNLGGGSCAYPDFFTFDADEGVSLSVGARSVGGAACASATETPYEFTLLDAAGEVRATGGADGVGCANLEVDGLSAGSYFLRVEPISPETPAAYRFEMVVGS